jgi:hypothetical protein
MKRKGHRSIPDFSQKRPTAPLSPDTKRTKVPPPPARLIKPHATSAKSGRRGQ